MALPDSFTASNGTDLATYDATWVKHGSYSGTNIEIQGNAAKLKAASGISLYYYNSAPSSADYSVTATLNVAATSGNTGGICARVSSSANTGYLARQNNNSIDLYKFVAGSFTLLGSKDDAITPPASPVDTLTVSGTSIIYVRNGVEKFNLTDADISAAGFCGMRINSAATNLTIDDFDCDGIGGGGVTGTFAITETGDTPAASGNVWHVGTLAATEAGDTFAGSGTIATAGTMAVTEAGDTFAASGTAGAVSVTGTLSVTEAGDTPAVAGTVGHVGTMAANEGGDVVAFVGTGSRPAAGALPSRFRQRRFLVAINGNRFLVPEGELAQWVQEHTEDLPPPKAKKKAKGQKQERIDAVGSAPIRIEAPKTPDYQWAHNLIAEANRAIVRKREEDEEDELMAMLLAA